VYLNLLSSIITVYRDSKKNMFHTLDKKRNPVVDNDFLLIMTGNPIYIRDKKAIHRLKHRELEATTR
jgi:hypothetical protein